jgi:hypothetical protein
LNELDISTRLDYFAGNLVTQNESGRCSRTSPHHVLIAAADVRGNHLEDDPVLSFTTDVSLVDARAILEFQLWVIDRLNLNFAWFDVRNCFISCHDSPQEPQFRVGRFVGPSLLVWALRMIQSQHCYHPPGATPWFFSYPSDTVTNLYAGRGCQHESARIRNFSIV